MLLSAGLRNYLCRLWERAFGRLLFCGERQRIDFTVYWNVWGYVIWKVGRMAGNVF